MVILRCSIHFPFFYLSYMQLLCTLSWRLNSWMIYLGVHLNWYVDTLWVRHVGVEIEVLYVCAPLSDYLCWYDAVTVGINVSEFSGGCCGTSWLVYKFSYCNELELKCLVLVSFDVIDHPDVCILFFLWGFHLYFWRFILMDLCCFQPCTNFTKSLHITPIYVSPSSLWMIFWYSRFFPVCS